MKLIKALLVWMQIAKVLLLARSVMLLKVLEIKVLCLATQVTKLTL